MADRGPANIPSRQADQALLPAFRVFLLVQVAVAALFGLGTFLTPGPFASLAGYTGHEPFYYRLVGAATLGYGVAALLAYWHRLRWPELRIPLVATFTFNLAAVVASALSLADGDRHPLVFLVVAAASAFTLLTTYWLIRNQGTQLVEAGPIESTVRVLIVVATAAAAVFGVAPLLLARPVASTAGFSQDDLFILRGAAAATLGYAVAGVLEVRATNWSTIRLQVIAAIVFNGLSALGAGLYLQAGGSSPVGWLILVAAAIFTLGLSWGLARAQARRPPT